jgi:predicted transcriptional regulator of viral defense system
MEQTLLDTLFQPLRCGGEAVVLETWEVGIKRIDADRMAEHLAKIGREDLDRRTGAILDLVGANFSSTLLGSRLKRLKERLSSGSQDVASIPLLPGFTFTEWNDTWKVQVP